MGKILFAAVALWLAIVVAFEASDEDVVDINEARVIGMGDVSLPEAPETLELVQTGKGGEQLTANAAANAANASIAAEQATSEASNVEAAAQSAETEAEDEENKLQSEEDSAKSEEERLKREEEEAERDEKEKEEKEKKDKEAKKEAEEHLQKVKEEAAKDGVAVHSTHSAVKAAKAKVAAEKKEISDAKEKADTLKRQFESMKDKYTRAQHKLDVLTGVAHKDETYEQYMARKEREKRNAARGAAAQLEDAERAVQRAEQLAAESEAAMKESKAKAKKLEAEADAAEKKAAALEAALEEAIKNGTVTKEMLEAAKAARAKADKAKGELAAEKVKLEHLKDKAAEHAAARDKAKKKATALGRLKEAEDQLVEDMKNKLADAKNGLKGLLAGMNDAEIREHMLLLDQQNRKKALAEASGDLAHSKAGLGKVQTKLKTLNGQIVADKKVHIDLSAHMKAASEITIPENTPVEKAKEILEDKERQVRETTEKLLATIKQEKAHINKQHQAMRDEAKLKNKVTQEEQIVVADTAKAADAEAAANNATAALKAVSSQVADGKRNETEAANAEKDAENTANKVSNNAEEAEEARKEAKKKSQDTKAEAEGVADEAARAEADVSAAVEQTKEVASTPLPNTTITVPDVAAAARAEVTRLTEVETDTMLGQSDIIPDSHEDKHVQQHFWSLV